MGIRRVVTGTGSDGIGRVVSDGASAHGLRVEGPGGVEVAYLWNTESPPAVPNGGDDPTGPDQALFPPSSGSRFIVNTYQPGFGSKSPDPTTESSLSAPGPPEQLLMHATTTVDYGIVLQGEITLVLPSGEEITLQPLDTVVQNGINHGWRNLSDDVAVVAFVIVGGHTAAEL